MSSELLLVGSIPLDTPQEVFATFGARLGKHLFAMPDGEVGPRRHWISCVHYQVLAAHPELEIVQRPAPDENGVERQFPRNAGDAWWFPIPSPQPLTLPFICPNGCGKAMPPGSSLKNGTLIWRNS